MKKVETGRSSGPASQPACPANLLSIQPIRNLVSKKDILSQWKQKLPKNEVDGTWSWLLPFACMSMHMHNPSTHIHETTHTNAKNGCYLKFIYNMMRNLHVSQYSIPLISLTLWPYTKSRHVMEHWLARYRATTSERSHQSSGSQPS